MCTEKDNEPWKLPSLDKVYYIENHGTLTLGQMLDGIAPDLMPANEQMFEDLLWSFGAWESREEMEAAMRTCEGRRTGFHLV